MGISSLIGLQAFLHIGVALGVFPATGLSLPFISFGRTNLVAMLASVGILLAVAREASGGEGRPWLRRRLGGAGASQIVGAAMMVVFSGGGTAGHFHPALNLARRWRGFGRGCAPTSWARRDA